LEPGDNLIRDFNEKCHDILIKVEKQKIGTIENKDSLRCCPLSDVKLAKYFRIDGNFKMVVSRDGKTPEKC